MAYTKQTARVARWQSDIAYDGSGSISSVPTSIFIVSRLVNDADPSDVRATNDFIGVSFDPLNTTGTITAAGKTTTYPQLLALMRQAGLDQANIAGAG